MIVALLLPCAGAGAVESSVRDLQTRPGVTLRFLLLKPERPAAGIVLFAGGHGGLGLGANGALSWGHGNFLVRSREAFVRHGLMVAVVDAPSDRLPQPALTGFRATAEHARDVAAVVAALRAEAKLPVWLVGTSRGATSVANAAVRLGEEGPDGIVLTAAVAGRTDPDSVDLMDLGAVAVPVLIVHHARDECRVTPFNAAKALLERFGASPRKAFLPFDGGGPPAGRPCEAHHWHGFVGIEEDVVKRIADWIKAQSKR
jgi:pimeloyl-ACP methyl ester carboxylesterase